MTVVLVAVDDSDAAAEVLATAVAVGELLEAPVRAVHVRATAATVVAGVAGAVGIELDVLDGDPVTEIVRCAGEPDVAVVVIGARGTPEGPRPCGHVAMAVAEQVHVPVLVVPPACGRDPGAPIRRALVPLEGTAATTAAVTDQLRVLADAGVEITALHVFDAASVPSFWDRGVYASETFAAEFASRWCPEPEVGELRLRRGDPGDAAVDVAETEDIDVIALGWSQNLAPGRAAVVRAVLERACVPVLLVPLSPG